MTYCTTTTLYTQGCALRSICLARSVGEEHTALRSVLEKQQRQELGLSHGEDVTALTARLP